MPYVQKWQPLAGALKRIMDSGVPEGQAKIEICCAVADKEIETRVIVDAADRDYAGAMLQGGNLMVPPRLGPGDFDWTRSRPFKAWSCGPIRPESYFDDRPWKRRSITLIELYVPDILRIWLQEKDFRPVDAITVTDNQPDGRAGDEEAAIGATQRDHGTTLIKPRRRGRKPAMHARVKDAILEDLKHGRISPAAFQDGEGQVKQKVLAHKYGARSRSTVMKAAKEALSEFGINSATSDSDK